MREKARRRVAAALGLVAAITPLAGCGGAEPTAGAAAGDDMSIVMVSHAPSTEPYWAVVANGLELAGEDFGVTTEYRGPGVQLQDPNEQRRLIEAAIAKKPDGLIVSDPYPQLLNPAIKKATDAGIPVVIINSGIGQSEPTGALTVIANDERRSGELGGERLKDAGVEHALIVHTPPGEIPLLDERSAGFTEGLDGRVTHVEVPVSELDDAVFIKNAVEAKLTKDDSIDGAMAPGNIFQAPLLEAANGLGARAEEMSFGGIDVTQQVLTAIDAGRWDFTLDQQQMTQPYLAVATLVLYHRYGVVPATDFIPTGPGLITADNAADVLELQREHVR